MEDIQARDNNTPTIRRYEMPKAQLILLGIILIGYPALSLTMNYFNQEEDVIISSRILQVYFPALLFQALIFFSLMIITLRSPLKRDGVPFNAIENIASIGIKPRDFNIKNIFIAVAFMLSAILLLNILSNILGYYGFFQSEDISYFLPRTPLERIFWIILSLCAGIAEELCFRGFVLSRSVILTGSVWPGVVFGALSFGIGHIYQGGAGVVLIGIYGLMFSLLFIARGSLVPCIIAHALQDILAAFAI